MKVASGASTGAKAGSLTLSGGDGASEGADATLTGGNTVSNNGAKFSRGWSSTRTHQPSRPAA